jgi:hypothetical protein
MGRFLQPDPIGFSGDATNLYRYCGNNPTNLTDPLGLVARIPPIQGNVIRIVVPVKYVSGGVSFREYVPPPGGVAAFVKGAEFLNGLTTVAGGAYRLSVQIVEESGGNLVTIFSAENQSSGTKFGSRTFYNMQGSDGQSPEYTAAHEILHLCGLEDEYTRDPVTGGKTINPGMEHNIMAGIGGTDITAAQLQKMIAMYGEKGRALAIALVTAGKLKLAAGSGFHGPLIPVTFSRTFGFSQGTNGSIGGFPEFGPFGSDAMGGTYGPDALGELGLGSGGGPPPNVIYL